MITEYFVFISYWLDPFFFIYFSAINLIYLTLLCLGSIRIYKRQQEIKSEDFTGILQSDSLPPISFFVAAYNESKHIIPMIDNLLALSYRYKQIIIINDGSTDNTFELLKEKYDLIPIPFSYKEVIPTKRVKAVYRSRHLPEIILIDKENGEKFDAINAALNICDTTYFITVDADTYIDDYYFETLIRPIFTSPETIAIGASVRIRNGCTLTYNRVTTERFPESYVAAMQAIEYLRSFVMRQGWDYAGGNFLLSGAFAVLTTEGVRKVGGYAPTNANDLEIVLRLNRAFKITQTPYKISYQLDPVAWTEGPSTLKALGRQRCTWQRGTLESVWFNKRLFFNPKYGPFGMFVFPFLVLGEAIEPVIEFIGCLYIVAGLWLGVVSWEFALLLLLIIFGFNFLFTIGCLLIEELTFRKYSQTRTIVLLIWYAFIENFGYRQLNLCWRLKGFLGFFKRFSTIKKDTENINARVDKLAKEGRIKW